MSDSYSQRKYAGLPVHELKQIIKEPPPKSFHGITGYRGGKVKEEITALHKLRPKDRKHWYFGNSSKFYVHIGRVNRCYQSGLIHVIRRLKAHLMINKSMKIFWLQAEATKQQISPEFHNYDCLINWLIYEGMSRGWLYVETGKYEWWDRKEQKQRVRKWTRLATT